MYAGWVIQPSSPPYFSSTFAPASSSCFLILAASSLLTSALTSLGAPSTRSLASFSPKPVIARTSLITLIFLSPASVRTTVNSVFSAAGAAAAPAGAAAAMATGAAAETPHLSSSSLARSAASSTVSEDRSSTSFSIFDISKVPSVGSGLDVYVGSRLSGVLLGISTDDTGKLTGGGCNDPGDLGRGRHKQAHDLATQFIQRRQGGEGFHARGIQRCASDRAAQDHELFVILGVGSSHLRSSHR